jgi:DNA polymerase IV
MKKIIFHIDVNNAFLAWTAVELLKEGHYDIRDKLAVIGGSKDSRRGVVLAKSVLAKANNIKTGERIYNALTRLPKLEVYPPNFELYTEKSNQLFEYLSNYTPDIEIFSVDECFIDYTPIKKLNGDPILFALKIQKEIYDIFGYTVNIGIGNNKFCAKMASDFSKPNKVHTLFEEEIKSKLWNIPIDQMLWVGNKSSIKLKEININTIGDLANADYSLVYKYFKNQTKKIMNYANGIDNDLVISSKWTPKGISNSTTFEKDLDDKKDILIVLRKLCDNVSISLREQKKYASVISVNIKDEYFKTNSHQRKLKNATNLSLEIYKEATILFNELWSKEPIRLIGIRLDQLSDNSNHQISLFENIEERKKDTKLDQTVDYLKNKFGDEIIKPTILSNTNIKKKKMK